LLLIQDLLAMARGVRPFSLIDRENIIKVQPEG